MFLNYYGLREQPFGVTPDPRFLYFSPSHREALASLYYGIETGRGFLALTAEPGMGKTTLLFHLLDKLRGSARTAFIFRTQCDSREFLRLLMADLGYSSHDDDPIRLQEQLNNILIRESRSGSRCILVVDEAQNLTDSVLETVRMLSNFETSRAKLMQILLAGQPQLAEKLASPNLLQLRQRVSILSRLNRLSLSETTGYINHRLQVAGYNGKLLFTPGALAVIASGSEGIPRNINNICFHALTLGFARQQHIIGAPLVEEVLADLGATPASVQGAGSESAFDRVSRPGLPSVEEIMVALDTPGILGSNDTDFVPTPDSPATRLAADQFSGSHSPTPNWTSAPILGSADAPEEAMAVARDDRNMRLAHWASRAVLVGSLVLLAGLIGAFGPRGWNSFKAHAEATLRAAMTGGRPVRKSSATPAPKPAARLSSDAHPESATRRTSGEVAAPKPELDPISKTSNDMAVQDVKSAPLAPPNGRTPRNAAIHLSRPPEVGRPVPSTAARPHVVFKRQLRRYQRAELADKLGVAKYYYDRGEYDLALDLFEAALRIDPSSYEAQTGAMRTREARSLHARLSRTSRPAL